MKTYLPVIKVLGSAALFSVATFTSTLALAQAPRAQTGIASPGRVDEQIQEPSFLQRSMPQIEVKELLMVDAPEGADKIVFTLDSVSLSGVTVYSETDLASVYNGMIGTEISLADVYGIAADLTRKYRNDGYILTQVIVPPQTIDSGAIKLQVVEGFIGDINVRGGEDESSLSLIRDYAQQAKTDSALNVEGLERALLLINDLPGVRARSILSPSASQTGAANLDVIVDRTSYVGEVGIDNYGTRFLGPVQLNGSVAANSLLGFNERITGQVAFGIDKEDKFRELSYGSVLYDQPIFTNGTLFSLFGSYTNTEPGYTLEEFNVKGYARRFYAELSHPFVRSRDFNVIGRTQFDYENVTTTNNLIGVDTLDDKVRAWRTGVNIDFLDTLFGVAYNNIDLEYAHGLDVFGATDANDDDVSRPGAEADFNKVNLSAQRLQRLVGNTNLLVGVTGQLSDGPLFSSEEFGLGGINYGRGYDASEVTGDDGFAAKVELQWNNPVLVNEDVDYQLYGFFDAGRVYDEDNTVQSLQKETLTSTGFGVRSDFSSGTAAGAFVALPLNKTPQTQDDQGPRFYFNLSQSF